MLSPSHTVITSTFLSRKNPTFLFRPKKKKTYYSRDWLEKQHKTSVRTIGMGRDYWTGGDGIEFNATQLKAKDCRTHSRCSYGSRSTSQLLKSWSFGNLDNERFLRLLSICFSFFYQSLSFFFPPILFPLFVYLRLIQSIIFNIYRYIITL